MHVVIVNFVYNSNDRLNEIYSEVQKAINGKISFVQRSDRDYKQNSISIDTYFVKDEFKQNLRWWQNPDRVNELIASLNPDIVHILGLNLPLHFRWLKHHISDTTILLAEHTGEKIWLQKNLWLQQFGLRVVDGFIFQSQEDVKPWKKCAAILERQPVFQIASSFKNDLSEVYNYYH